MLRLKDSEPFRNKTLSRQCNGSAPALFRQWASSIKRRSPALILADWRGSQKKYHPTNRKAR